MRNFNLEAYNTLTAKVAQAEAIPTYYRVYGYEEDGTKWLLGTGTSHAEAVEIANLAAPAGIIETISIQLWRDVDFTGGSNA